MELPNYAQPEHFASPNLIEQLRREYGADPDSSANVARATEKIERTLKRLYGSYMVYDFPSVSDRIVALDRHSVIKLLTKTAKGLTGGVTPKTATAVFKPEGRYIIFSTSGHEVYSEEYGYPLDIFFYSGTNDEKGRKYNYRNGVTNLCHEISHYYQDMRNPWGMRECGAYYYGPKIAKRYFPEYAPRPYYEQTKAVFYENALEKYGDDVHRVYFGAESVDRGLRQSIRGHFTEETMALLFPGEILIPKSELQPTLGPEEPINPADPTMLDVTWMYTAA